MEGNRGKKREGKGRKWRDEKQREGKE